MECHPFKGSITMYRRRHIKAAAALGGVVALTLTSMSSAWAERADTPAGEKDCTSLPDAARAQLSGPIDLEEITEQAGLLDPLKGMMVHAAATGDVNDDGWLDLFVGTFADRPAEDYLARGSSGRSPDRLLLGGPDGFTVDETFPEMYGRTSGSVFADLDNDGDLDLVLARNAKPLNRHSTNDTLVLRNDDGEFSESTVLSTEMRGRTVAVLDYDDDGLLDLFVIDDHYGSGGDSKLFRNLGDLEFEDATEAAGLPAGMTGLSASAADLNNDGRPDILLSGTQRTEGRDAGILDSQVARLFLNEGGSFREVDASAFRFPTATPTDEVAGLAVADLNRDGLLDVVQGNHIHDNDLLEQGVPAVKVYLHRGMDETGAPQFEDVTQASGIPDAHTRVPHAEIVDFDADGWPDILTSLSRGDGTEPAVFRHTGLDEDGIPVFAVPSGLGDERTTPPTESGWERIGLDRYWANGAAADYDRDGKVDSFLSEWFQDLPSRLFQNNTRSGNGLFVELAPRQDAVGARIEVYCKGELGDPEGLIGTRALTLEVGYGAGLPHEVHFGLGHANKVDVRVVLPNSGDVIERTGVRAGTRLTISTDDR
jgi:hypothetical protein